MSNNTSYKTIKEISEKLLSSLKSAGVVLTEGQKSDVDDFVKAIESKLEEQKYDAIRATKTVVERRMDEEYKKVFESILKHQDVYNRLLEKIAIAKATKAVTEEMAEAVDGFIGEKLEECIPDEAIVDYHRLQNLEKTVAALKETLLIGDEEVQKAVSESEKRISESFAKKEKVLHRNLLSARRNLRKALAESAKVKRETEKAEAARLLEEKTKDLPAYEASKIKKLLEGKTAAEIKAKFNSVYESVAEAAVEEANSSLVTEISEIIAGEEKKTDGEKKDKEFCGKKPAEPGSEESGEGSDKEQVQESMLIDESVEMFDNETMLAWMQGAENINTRLF